MSSQNGRQKLNQEAEKLVADLQSSSSTKTKEVLNKISQFRGLIAAGASANPGATIAVAGLFIAFDLILLHRAEEAYISEILIQVADIACRSELLFRFIEVQPYDDTRLSNAREALKAALVQLKRISLLLTMKIIYKLNRWHKYFLAPGAWGNRLKTLQDAKTRVDEYVRDINYDLQNPLATGSNWSQNCERLPQLHRLVQDGRVDDVYKMITDNRCPPTVLNEKTQKGWTALMFAARDGQWKILTWLLRCAKIEVNAKNNNGDTALVIAAKANRPKHIKKLIDAGAKLNIRNKHKRTAWLEATILGKLNAMKTLLEDGDDINQVTGIHGWCALHTAVQKDYLKIQKWLLEKGAKTDIKIKAGSS